MVLENSALDDVLARLHRVQRTGNGWMASCPVAEHGQGRGDLHPSLSIQQGQDDRVLLACQAGCDTHEIVESVGLRMADLFQHGPSVGNVVPRDSFEPSNPSAASPESAEGDRSTGTRSVVEPDANSGWFTPDLTLQALGEAKRLPVDFLRAMGCSDTRYRGGCAIQIVYPNPDGTPGPIRYRTALEKPARGNRFAWKRGCNIQMLGLDRLDAARETGYVIMVEGETDYFTLAYTGMPGLGVPGATSFREDRDASQLGDIAVVFAIVEPDQGGESFRHKLGTSSIRDRVRFIDLSPFGVKDLNALWCDDPDSFTDRIEQAKADAVPWTTHDAQARTEAAEVAYVAAKSLLHADTILAEVRSALVQMGYAGDVTPALIAYLAIASRFLSRPIHTAFIARSASGKNHAVDTARRLHPDDAIIEYKASSERAMIYDDNDLAHRVVLFGEADSIPEDGPAASAVRSLVSDQMMSYDVVQRDASTGRMSTRHIRRPGPTALMTTSTRSLAHQFDTRLLEVTISDSEEQTRAVMQALAAAVMPGRTNEMNTAPFIALQEWIRLAGCHDVAVPFAKVLAGMVPARAVRMRRDFRQLLTCVQVHAMLHQYQRARTEVGQVIAIIADYAGVRDVLSATFEIATSDGLTAAVRETVEAIAPGEEVTQQQLCDRLGMAKSSVSHRVKRALAGGWLVNKEQRKNHPHQLARAASLPEEGHSLPAVDALRAAFDDPTGGGPNPHTEAKHEHPGRSGQERLPFGCSNERRDQEARPLIHDMGVTSTDGVRTSNGRVAV